METLAKEFSYYRREDATSVGRLTLDEAIKAAYGYLIESGRDGCVVRGKGGAEWVAVGIYSLRRFGMAQSLPRRLVPVTDEKKLWL